MEAKQASHLVSNVQMAATSSLLLSTILLLLLLRPSPSTANQSNVLLTGDVLPTDSELSRSNVAFVIQDDCNLVLYNGGHGFQSNTHGAGVNCTLSLNDLGQLLIKSGYGTVVWETPEGPTGNYAAVIQPNRQVGVFGPRVWSTPEVWIANNETDGQEFSAAPSDKNLLFSSQVLNAGEELATRDYSFAVATDCGLALTKATGNGVLWQTETTGMGEHCHVRLNFKGQLALLNDNNDQLWVSNGPQSEGSYVFVVQINGAAAIYGPLHWSTATY